MMWRSVIFMGCAVTASAGRRTEAQGGGRFDERTEYEVITGPSVAREHGPSLAIVLWRGAPGWLAPTGPSRARADSVSRWARLRAEESGLSFFGSGLAYGFVDRSYGAVTVEGQVFSIASRDSALVIMVTVAGIDKPRTVATARLAISAIPQAFWAKTWQSGDTTFLVHVRYPQDVQMLREALVRVPAVATFLR